jgi:shikimate kinase
MVRTNQHTDINTPMYLKTFLKEYDFSPDDKESPDTPVGMNNGLFKAIFMVGTPGAGKSYVGKQIIASGIHFKIINTDKHMEKMAQRQNKDISNPKDAEAFWKDHKDIVQRTTMAELSSYIDRGQPLLVDTTNTSMRRVKHRVKLLESIGYDVVFVWINTSLDTALSRASKRDRGVPEEFIKKLKQHEPAHKQQAKDEYATPYDIPHDLGKPNNFKPMGRVIEINNDHGELTQDIIKEVSYVASKYLDGHVNNVRGRQYLAMMTDSKSSRLSTIEQGPEFSVIKRIASHWYS